MDKKNIPLEARKAFTEFKEEIAEELSAQGTHIYDLRSNLSKSDDVTPQLLETKKKSRQNPSFSFHDFLGKGF